MVALLLTVKTTLIWVYRTVYYLPSILGGSVVIAILWRFLFMTEAAVINDLLGPSGPARCRLARAEPRPLHLSLLPVWQFGSSMVHLPRGAQEHPRQSSTRRPRSTARATIAVFRHLTIPLLTPIIFFNLVMQMINALQEFTGPFIITGGGPLQPPTCWG